MNENQVLSTFAAYSLNESERLSSSSGGIFSLLARAVLSSGGCIYGVAMSQNCRRAEYVRVDDLAGLGRLRGSKYFQAYVGDAFKHVKEDLNSGVKVLFSGTACQINGLIGYLGAGGGTECVREKYPNLYCVDVICHGVPSPALWCKYVEYIENTNDAHLVSINFRCKDKGWTDFGMKEIDANHKAMYVSKDTDPFMQMFLRDYCLRPSCYECKAKQSKLSDLTIADFWGIEDVAPEMTDGNGTSFVIVRSERGKELFDAIKNQLCTKEVRHEDGVRGNPAEYKSAVRPAGRENFFNDMTALTFEELKVKYASPIQVSLKRRMKRKIKSEIKKLLIRVGLWGGGTNDNASYGLLFVLRVRG